MLGQSYQGKWEKQDIRHASERLKRYVVFISESLKGMERYGDAGADKNISYIKM
jgi:hypothetical protein